jgi:hypothetical protein
MFRILMYRRMFLTVALLLNLFIMLPHTAGQESAPWVGTWKLNPAKSSNNSDPPRYKRTTCRIEPWEDGLKVTYDLVGIRGGVTHMEWTGRFDGKDYPMQGVDSVLTNAYRRIDDRTYEIVVKVDGKVVATSRVAVSPDGKELRVSTEERTASGTNVTTTAVYERQ